MTFEDFCIRMTKYPEWRFRVISPTSNFEFYRVQCWNMETSTHMVKYSSDLHHFEEVEPPIVIDKKSIPIIPNTVYDKILERIDGENRNNNII